MGKKYRGKDILEELEEKKKNPIVPIVIFLCVVTVLSVITTIGIKLIDEHTDIDIPWVDSSKNKNKNKLTSSRDQMKLTAPKITGSDYEMKEDLDSIIRITNITADKRGFIVDVSLKTTVEEYTTIEVKQIAIDGFYVTSTFAISDRLDCYDNGTRKPPQEQAETPGQFIIRKTELDELDMFGFNNMSIIYDISTPNYEKKDREFYVRLSNDLHIVNNRKGLINVDKKNEVEVNYYKTVTADDATYIYFDFKNENKFKDIKVYVKELIINNKVYDMSYFEEISHRNSRESIYLSIPTKDVPRVNSMKVKFFLVDENANGEKSFYITNEYQKAY